MSRKKLLSVTAADCRWVYYNGTGKGGQNRNKRANCVRCFHDPSGAMGKSEDERDQAQNKRLAWKRMVASKAFQSWLKTASMKANGTMQLIEEAVEREMKKVKVEKKNEEGRWVNWDDETNIRKS